MMTYYGTTEEENFFEKKRFKNNDKPTYGDISFLKDIVIKKLKLDIDKDKDEILSDSEWEKLKPILYFNEKNNKIDHLRRHAFSKQPLFFKYIENDQIIPLEKLPYNNYPSLIEAMKDANISSYSSLYEHFATNEHIGTCGYTSIMVASMFSDFKFYSRGNAKFLAGTKNCIDGGHAWIETNINGKDLLIDTSLLLAIPIELKEKLGYSSNRKPYNREEMLDVRYNFDDFYEMCEISSKYSTKCKMSYNQYMNYVKELEFQEKQSLIGGKDER